MKKFEHSAHLDVNGVNPGNNETGWEEKHLKHLGTKQIETDRLILRRFTVEDAPKMYENWASDEEVAKYLTWPAHADADVTAELLARWTGCYGEVNHYNWCMQLKEDGELIGNISVVEIKEQVQSAAMGYCIGRKYWHQGFASEALKAVMDFLFDEVGVNRVEAVHDARNPHSGQVMKKSGLLYEGTKIEAGFNTSGVCDEVHYGLTKRQRNAQANGQGQDSKASGRKNVISDKTIEYVGILAKLELSEEEKERAKKDMGDMLDYIDKLNELDTTGVEPMSHVFPVNNVFREDVVENGDDSDNMLKNAPDVKEQSYVVPKTVE